MSSVLITGVSGFLGRYVAQEFRRGGYVVYGIDAVAEENAPLQDLDHYRCLSLPNDAIVQLLDEVRPNACIHCAGRASVPHSLADPAADFQANTTLTFFILDALRKACPSCRFLQFSSAAVYGNPARLPVAETDARAPMSPYGFHKVQAELACEEFALVYGLHTAALRIFSAYGAGLRRQLLWDVCKKAVQGDHIDLRGTGEESRDFVHARDVAKAARLVVERAPMKGECYNLANGAEVPIAEVARRITASLDDAKEVRFDQVTEPGMPTRWHADISRISALGFHPSVAFEDGVREYVNWARALIDS